MSTDKAATQTQEKLFALLSEFLKDLLTSPEDTKTDYQGYYQRFHALGLRQELEELNETLPKHSSSLLEVAEKVSEHKNGLIDCYREQKRLEKLHETATKRKAIVEQMLQIMKEEEHPLFLAMEVLDSKRLMNEEQDPIFWAMKEKNDALAEQREKEDAEMPWEDRKKRQLLQEKLAGKLKRFSQSHPEIKALVADIAAIDIQEGKEGTPDDSVA